ncbi:hypothetical protein T552_02495 [Pneumocystis carinii B80]|uniref:Chromatin structure-remodeling complex protein RSC7 n=1 Tax=Pneumocystis carinii (strain B80) TaxID=1408658 RepID=A0A0W4ZF66_PNEC8|nr:hypothetical protein T552_02495 [Pneumocystis carinii B80]KTW27003.1 hypothetical protein T552_02495 [Pneumocystis carinii B80]
MSIEPIGKANYGPPRRLLDDDEIFLLEELDIVRNRSIEEENIVEESKEWFDGEKSPYIKCKDDILEEKDIELRSTLSRAELLVGRLTSSGDEYLDIEVDSLGEEKVDRNGYLKGGRKYNGKTFEVVGHGKRLFMLGTEVARIMNYRDSYLLFLKNKTLRKIMISQEEKYDLISKEIIPYSYRSRQIAIVSARSVFRRFGSRVIVSGKRGKDDYFEQMAKDAGIPVEKYIEDSDRHKYPVLLQPSIPTVKNDDQQAEIQPYKSTVLLNSFYNANTTPSPIFNIAQHAKSAVEFNKQITIQRKEREHCFHKHFYKR